MKYLPPVRPNYYQKKKNALEVLEILLIRYLKYNDFDFNVKR